MDGIGQDTLAIKDVSDLSANATTSVVAQPSFRAIGAKQSIHAVTPPRFLARLRYQLLLGLLFAVILPTGLANLVKPFPLWASSNSINTALGSGLAFLTATYLFRRVATFPGAGIWGQVLPALTAAYGVILAGFFGLRLDYSRIAFFGSFIGATSFFFVVSFYLRNYMKQRFYVVPTDTIGSILSVPDVEWVLLTDPKTQLGPSPVLVADLRADLAPEWERLIAEVAVAGHPVYHLKQVQESLTGRVAIEHLSENSFGSLLPNHGYRKIKRILDAVIAVAALPILLLPGLIVALMIKLESPGPVFFRQKRKGYRGKTFEVVKFRTMMHRQRANRQADREDAVTRHRDERITRVGRFLRRTRIDEVPQILNIIKGEMSWIGPRPEAISLSEWYEAELPFYTYRHIVRPGITGWAQVNQGHVADLESVYEKLHYDFYYIKNFSAWLDLLILGRTIATVCFGYGAR